VDLAKLPVNCHGFIFKESIKALGKKQKCCQLLSELEKYIEEQFLNSRSHIVQS